VVWSLGGRLVPVQCRPFAGGLSGKPSASLHPSHFAALVGPSRSRGRGRPRVFRATRPAQAHSGLGCIPGPFCTRADQTVTLRCIQSRFCTCNGDGSQRGKSAARSMATGLPREHDRAVFAPRARQKRPPEAFRACIYARRVLEGCPRSVRVYSTQPVSHLPSL